MLLAVVGFAVQQVVPLYLLASQGLSATNPAVLLTFLGGAPFFAPAVVLVRRSRRHLAVSAAQAMREDLRSPVVYLRSFNSDERVGRVGLGGYGLFVFLWPAAFYAIAKEWRGSSEEQYWSSALAQVGPPIALGAPGKLPFRGAARLYVSDDRWRDVVTDFAAHAALVVVLGGLTEALQWEIRHVASSVPRQKLLILLPNDQEQYGEFRDALRREMSVDAGEHPSVAHSMNVCGVLHFDREDGWQVVPVWGASQTGVEAALAPVREQIATEPQRLEPRPAP